MQILERLKSDQPVFSFEFFPPKTEKGDAQLWNTLQELRSLSPAFVSVTYGAGGSTRIKTVELTSRIKQELGIEAMAHLTCVGATREELTQVVNGLAARGIENIMALRGDPPRGEDSFRPVAGGFSYANELISHLSQHHPGMCLGAACYPEGHVEAPSKEKDLENLKRKVDAGAQFLVTQLFFDNRHYFDFVDRALAVGINVPIVPGIMPITNVAQIERFTKMCGATIPEELTEGLNQRREQPEQVHELGVIYATIQCLGLLQGGAPGIHFYTLNKSTSTQQILAALRMHARL